MSPIEAYKDGIDYLGETGTGYAVIAKPAFKIFWSGDNSAIATVTDGNGFSEQALLPLPGDSMVTRLPDSTEIVVYRK